MEVENEILYCISFNYKAGKVRIYKSVLVALNFPKYIQILYSAKNKYLYIIGLDKREKDCFPTPSCDAFSHNGFVLNGQQFIKRLSDKIGWSLDSLHLIYGYLDIEKCMIVFDLTTKIK